jgi:hypothetical protein
MRSDDFGSFWPTSNPLACCPPAESKSKTVFLVIFKAKKFIQLISINFWNSRTITPPLPYSATTNCPYSTPFVGFTLWVALAWMLLRGQHYSFSSCCICFDDVYRDSHTICGFFPHNNDLINMICLEISCFIT